MPPAPEDAALGEGAPSPAAGTRPASRRRPPGPILTVIRWRDIPAQVTARDGERTEKRELHRRFQVAIDRAAAVAGLETYDRYIAEWRSESRPCGADLAAEMQAVVKALEGAHPRHTLDALVRNGGLAAPAAQEPDPA